MLEQFVFDLLGKYGPAPTPPASMMRMALRLIRQVAFEAEIALFLGGDFRARAERTVEDIVIAFGCGYRRLPDPWAGEWNRSRWPAAYEVLRGHVRRWVLRSALWLQNEARIEGLRGISDPDRVESMTNILLAHLLRGGCQCYRSHLPFEAQAAGINPVGAPVLSESLKERIKRCLLEHYLNSWDPLKLSLADFVTIAIKGPVATVRGGDCGRCRRVFAVGTLVQGMLFQLVRADFGLRPSPVLCWKCLRHATRNFYGMPCIVCESAAAGSGDAPRLAELFTSPWLVVPAYHGGAFHPVDCVRCPKCRRLLLVSGTDGIRCPWDGASPSPNARRFQVWIPKRGPHLELDAPTDDEDDLRATPAEMTTPFHYPAEVTVDDLLRAIEGLPSPQREVMDTLLDHNLNLKAAARALRMRCAKAQDVVNTALTTLKTRLVAMIPAA